MLMKNKFLDDLKLADFSGLFKKDDRTNKTTYRPISLLPTISKLFERFIYEQPFDFIVHKLSTQLWGFKKSFNTQQVLLNILQNFKHIIDKNGIAGVVFIDLLKVFDSTHHDHLIAKLYAHGLSINGLELIQNHLSNCKTKD